MAPQKTQRGGLAWLLWVVPQSFPDRGQAARQLGRPVHSGDRPSAPSLGCTPPHPPTSLPVHVSSSILRTARHRLVLGATEPGVDPRDALSTQIQSEVRGRHRFVTKGGKRSTKPRTERGMLLAACGWVLRSPGSDGTFLRHKCPQILKAMATVSSLQRGCSSRALGTRSPNPDWGVDVLAVLIFSSNT